MNNKVYLKGYLTILKYLNEQVIEKYYYENLITDVGLNYLLQLVGNDVNLGINKLAIGSGNAIALKTDTSLQTKLLLLDAQKDYSISGRVNFMTSIPANTFGSIVSYNEAGLVCKSSTSEILITRLVFGDTIYQKPENSLSLLYSLELRA
jgi:hypothetical protein